METVAQSLPSTDELADMLVSVGRYFDARGWVPASSGNFSARLSADTALVTASGRHKGELSRQDFLQVNLQAGSCQPADGAVKPSYETGLHLQLYRRDPQVGAVLHSHSVAATVLSRACGNSLVLQGYELQKLFDGYVDPQETLSIPVFSNEQDIELLAGQIDTYMDGEASVQAYLIKGHGLYAWGKDIEQARYRIEALEFMLACELHASKRTFGASHE